MEAGKHWDSLHVTCCRSYLGTALLVYVLLLCALSSGILAFSSLECKIWYYHSGGAAADCSFCGIWCSVVGWEFCSAFKDIGLPDTEDEGTVIVWNVGTCLPNNTVLHAWTVECSASLLSEPQSIARRDKCESWCMTVGIPVVACVVMHCIVVWG